MPAGLQDAPPKRRRAAARHRAAILALGVVVAAYVVVAFYPFRLDPPRRVDNGAVLDGRVLTVTGDALARTPEAPAWLARAKQTGEFWVTAEVRSFGLNDRPVRVLDIEASHTRADLRFHQFRDDLVVSLRRPDSDLAGDPGLYVPGVFRDTDWHELALVAGPDSFSVSVDGAAPVSHEMTRPGAYRNWDTGFRLYVGDAADGNRSWRGQVRVLEAGSGDIREDYLAPGALDVPDRIWYVPERVDDPIGWRSDRDLAITLAAIHFVSYMPAGVAVGAVVTFGRRRRSHVGRRRLAGALGIVALTALTQAGKVVFDARHAALVDLGVETLGALAGYVLWLAYAARRAGRRAPRGDVAAVGEE